jgi:(4S)-4-hydroxy-5-phosphonooxypentane-2,3-dione isomerase
MIPGQQLGRIKMPRSISIATGTLALCIAGVIALPLPGQRVAAQSPGMYVNAVDLDIVPAEHDNFVAAIKENGAATAKEPGCRRFDILNLSSDPNHFFLYEVFDNEAAFKAHRETDHFKKYIATTGKMVAKRDARQMSVVAGNSQAK